MAILLAAKISIHKQSLPLHLIRNQQIIQLQIQIWNHSEYKNPTKYFLKVNAIKPYLLVFEEPYDPLWIAKINYDGGKSSVYKSTQVYSLLNGFFINKPGEYEVEIMYMPQDWFQIGTYVSVIGLFVICGY